MSVARFIADQRTFYRVPYAVCCVILGVSQSWFYKWLNHDSRGSSFLCGDSRRITMRLRRALAQSLHPVRPSGARSDSVSGVGDQPNAGAVRPFGGCRQWCLGEIVEQSGRKYLLGRVRFWRL